MWFVLKYSKVYVLPDANPIATAAQQDFIETSLNQLFKKLPVFLDSKCHFDLRKYFCASAYVAPEFTSLGEVLESNGIPSATVALFGLPLEIALVPFTMPQFPHYSVCTDYMSSCAGFILSANQSVLIPNCSSKSSLGDFFLYPKERQTIKSLSLGPSSLSLSASPKYYNESTVTDSNYAPVCPGPYLVIPDNPHIHGVRYIPGTPCAVSCKATGLYSLDEMRSFYTMLLVVSCFSVVGVGIFLTVWLTDKNRRKQTLIIAFGVLNFIMAFYNLGFNINMLLRGVASVHCHDNSTSVTALDGVNSCTVQIFVILYFHHAMYLTWMCIAIDVFLKVILNIKKSDKYIKFMLAAILLLPCIPVILLAVVYPHAMSGWTEFGVCWTFGSGTDVDYNIFVIPALVIVSIGSAFMAAVLFHILFINKGKDVLNTIKIPILFVTFFLINFISILQFRLTFPALWIKTAKSFPEFFTCLLINFDGIPSSIDKCGTHIKTRIPPSATAWFLFCFVGEGVFFSLIFMSGHYMRWGAAVVYEVAAISDKSGKSAVASARLQANRIRRSILVQPAHSKQQNVVPSG